MEPGSQEHCALLLAVGHHLQDVVQGYALDRHDQQLDIGVQRLENGVLQARPGDEGHGDIEETVVFHRILDRIVHGDPVHFLTAAARRNAGNDVRPKAAHELGAHRAFPAGYPLNHHFCCFRQQDSHIFTTFFG